jgi:hypothetical protein
MQEHIQLQAVQAGDGELVAVTFIEDLSPAFPGREPRLRDSCE